MSKVWNAGDNIPVSHINELEVQVETQAELIEKLQTELNRLKANDKRKASTDEQ
jgi:uncharacterized small protein (DUF1192 family)